MSGTATKPWKLQSKDFGKISLMMVDNIISEDAQNAFFDAGEESSCNMSNVAATIWSVTTCATAIQSARLRGFSSEVSKDISGCDVGVFGIDDMIGEKEGRVYRPEFG
jgi:hypothetical protein